MLVRVAIALEDKAGAETLTNRLISYSLRSDDEGVDIDFDISFYRDLKMLLNAYNDVDISFISYGLLDANCLILSDFYHKNPMCISIPIGSPDEKICDYLELRPSAHLTEPSMQNQIDTLCLWCINEMRKSKNVLQIHTKKGVYAVSIASILYCSSDLKYIVIVAEQGAAYRKCGKLDTLAADMPSYFLRVHQSYLVNLHHVTGVDKTTWELLLDDGSRIPVSRAYQKTVSDRIQKDLFAV